MIGLVVLILMSFGCAKIEQSDIFQILDVQIRELGLMPDGTIRILLQPLYGYSNSTNEIVVVEENWVINGVSVQIYEFETLAPTGSLFKEEWDHFSLQHFLPKGTKEVEVSGTFRALYPSGTIIALMKTKKIPITW